MALTRITQGVIKPNENYIVNNINSSGVTTSTNFKTGTSNLHNVGIEIAGINVLGADTPIGLGATIYNSGAAIFSGDVKVGGALTVGGVLTYEDVTNIDSVGVITARGDISIADKIVHTGDTNTAIRFPTADTITAETAGSERLRIDLNGKLLIGTTSSRQTRLGTNTIPPNLQIESDAVAAFSMTRWNTGTSPSRLILQKGRGSTASPAVVADGDQVGQILFSGWDGDTFTNTAQIRSVVDGTPGDDQMPGNLVFATNSGGTATTTRMVIKADGKIGINVAEPTTKLQIGSTTVDSDNVITLGKRVSSSETNLPKIGQHSDNGASSSLALCATSSSGKIHFFTGNGGTGFGASSNAERMRITSGGNIGIGTVSPQERLHLYAGNCALEVDAPANRYCSVGFSVDGASKWWMGRGDSDVLLETSFFIGKDGGSAVDKGGNSAKFVIDTNGNIGIGVTNPGNALEIYGTATTVVAEVNGTGRYRGYEIHEAGTRKAYFQHDATDNCALLNTAEAELKFYTSDTQVMELDGTGRLLVGGHTTASIVNAGGIESLNATGANFGVGRFVASAVGPDIVLVKSRNATLGSHTVVQDDDLVGTVKFRGSDGGEWVDTARIASYVD